MSGFAARAGLQIGGPSSLSASLRASAGRRVFRPQSRDLASALELPDLCAPFPSRHGTSAAHQGARAPPASYAATRARRQVRAASASAPAPAPQALPEARRLARRRGPRRTGNPDPRVIGWRSSHPSRSSRCGALRAAFILPRIAHPTTRVGPADPGEEGRCDWTEASESCTLTVDLPDRQRDRRCSRDVARRERASVELRGTAER